MVPVGTTPVCGFTRDDARIVGCCAVCLIEVHTWFLCTAHDAQTSFETAVALYFVDPQHPNDSTQKRDLRLWNDTPSLVALVGIYFLLFCCKPTLSVLFERGFAPLRADDVRGGGGGLECAASRGVRDDGACGGIVVLWGSAGGVDMFDTKQRQASGCVNTVLTLLGAGVHPLGLTPAKITVHPKNTGLTPKVLG